MKNVLITGGAGFIPGSLAKYLVDTNEYFVVSVDNFLTGNIQHVHSHPNLRFIKCDVNRYQDISAVMLHHRFDYVFHYAAVVGVKRTLDHPKMVLEDIYGLQHIFDLSKNTGVKRVFYSSSSEVYGEPVHLPQHEQETPLNSRLPYAVVKNVGESFCRAFKQEFDLDYTIFRFFNTYGPWQSEDFVVSRFIKAALAGRELTLYGDGSQTRTFCFIDDNLEFTIKTLKGNYFINEVVNVGHAQLVTIKELAETIIRLSGSTSKIVHLPPLKEGDMTRRQPDNTKMTLVLARPMISLEEGISRMVEFAKRHSLM